MNNVFDTCKDALRYAIEHQSFGVYHSRENLQSTNVHTHECCEIFLCLKGGSTFLIDGRVYSVDDGSLFFMNQFEPHKITFLKEAEVDRYVLQIHPELMLRLSTQQTVLSDCFYHKGPHCNKILLSAHELSIFQGYFEELSREYPMADDVIKNSIIMRFLAQMNTLASRNQPNSGSSLDNTALRLAMEYVDHHYQDELSLNIIAKNAYISVNQLCKLFKKYLDTTVSKYIISKRISEAKKLLTEGRSVSETAAMCGFRDYANFIRTFSAHVGISPGKYHKFSVTVE